MPDQTAMKAAMLRYIEAFNAEDAEQVCALYADDATIEDPVGAPPIQGKAAIRAFYDNAVATGAKLSLAAPVRGSHGDAAAMAFAVDLPAQGLRIHVIDVMTFDAAGKFASMRAYWGPEDMGPA